MHAQTNLQLYEQLADRPLEERVRVRAGYELAMRLFAGRYRADGRPFVSHLVGTASALARHGAAPPVVLAGLLHAAYEQGDFGTRRAQRAPLREAIGAEAEELVTAYHAGEDRREVVWMRVANEIDDCMHRALLYAGAGKRAAVEDRVIRFVAAARALGADALANELEEVFATNEGEVPDALVAPRDRSFTILPKIRTVLRRRWKEIRRRR